MSVKSRCGKFCDDCDENETRWKLVESTSLEAEHHKIKNGRLVKCQVKTEKSDECPKKQQKKCPKKCPKKCCQKQTIFDCEKKCPDNCKPKPICPCNNFASTLISVRNPQTELIIPELPLGNVNVNAIIGEAVDLTDWTDLVPDVFDAFNNATGIYTAPETGDYDVRLVVNYETNVPIPVSPLLVDVPIIEIYNVLDDAHILASFFPTIVLVIPVPPPSTGEPPFDITVAAIMSKGQVVIGGIIPLTAGQQIRVRAVTNGLVYNPTGIPPVQATIDFSPAGVDTVLTIYKIRNSPIVSIDLNN